MTEPPRPTENPTEDVLAAIQGVIDAPRLPFPARDLRPAAERDGLEARVARLEAILEFQRDIADIKAELQIVKAKARSSFWLIFVTLIVVAFGLASVLAKGFHWL
ncbi:MAG: hypothetical protein ACREEK_19650 [Bradyrhizobium sp.]